MQVAIQRILDDRGFGAYTAHFDAIGEDGRFSRLPLAAASTLMARGYGYAAEGDVLTACLVYAGHTADRGRALHRDVRDGLPVGLGADEPHGRGQLEDRPRRTGRCG